MRKINFDKEWYFSQEDREDCIDNLYDFSSWRKLNVPHDWSTEHVYEKEASSANRGGYVRTGVGYYKKVLYVTEAMMDQYVAIDFDGVYMNSEVYINGVLLGKRPYGYISFGYELSEHLHVGMNIITVKVDDSLPQSSRWYNGCGIYRHVWLTVANKLHVERWGTKIVTPIVEKASAMVDVEVIIVSPYSEEKTVKIQHVILDKEGKQVASTVSDCNLVKGENTVNVSLEVTKPALWSVDEPNLYQYGTEIRDKQTVVDTDETTFGIRKLEYIANKGFYLNGQNLKFKGVCQHHDAGVVGAAVPDKIKRKRLKILKDMGCNAVRTSHNPFAPEFYDLCDELGLMVVDEIFDGWNVKKAKNDYGLYFDEWHERDLVDFIKRDRNHPSIVMWSIGNEVTQMSTEINQKLSGMIKEMDPTRPITCGVNGVSDTSEANRALLDIAGYNDGGGACFLYDRDHESRPNQLLLATEAPHTYQTRGFYRTQTWWRDKNLARIEIENLCEEELFFDGHLAYRSSYDNAGVRVCVRDSWKLSEERAFLLGEFRWTGFDYYGESYGWPARWNDHGIIGLENYPKDTYYLYQSMWTHEPMVHLLPHWTHLDIKEGTKIPVWVYTNCEEAEVFLNGESQGRVIKGEAKHIQWDVPYYPGKLEVVAYNSGAEAARKAHMTAGIPDKIEVTADSQILEFDGVDTSQIDVKICDKEGNMVPYGENTLFFKGFGDVMIVGIENGNCVDTTPLYAHKRKAFNGLCMAIVKGQEVIKGDGVGGILVASILGEVVFKESTQIKVVLQGVDLSNSTSQSAVSLNSMVCKIKLNDGEWMDYTDAITIKETTHVRVLIYDKHEILYDIASIFTKGKREPVVDLAHGNKALNLKKPVGPFALEMAGLWTGGEDIYEFKKDGEFVRKLGKSEEQHLGYWWYDFPIDPFESEGYAGQGEVWFNTGEKNKLTLVSQESKEVVLDNSNAAIRASWECKAQLELKRLQ